MGWDVCHTDVALKFQSFAELLMLSEGVSNMWAKHPFEQQDWERISFI